MDSARDNVKMPQLRRWSKACLTLLLVTGLGFLFDRLLYSEGVPNWGVVLFSNFDVGILAAVLTFLLEERAERRHRMVEERLRVIAEMNHHIRNALQVIVLHAATGANEKALEDMKGSVNRIQWALREVLPGLPEP
jgi:hypothetical protein